tara:strand:+ start:2406 stop:5036 length:2631 start_codon:yes stop_codon:yes gene_type:complete
MKIKYLLILLMSQHSNLSNLVEFLELHKVKKGEPHSHMSYGNIKGSFYIADTENDTFFELYGKAILDGNDISLIEKHKSIGPIVIDLDFKHTIPEDGSITRRYTETDITNILKLFYDQIKKIFKCDESDLSAFVFERTTPYKHNDIIKDGIHIMFPNIISEPHVQYFIRNNVLKNITTEFDTLDLINKNHDVIDRAVIKSNGWFLYGSTKPKLKKYKLATVYNNELQKVELSDVDFKGQDNLARFFSIRQYTAITTIDEDIEETLLETKEKKNVKTKVKEVKDRDIKILPEMVDLLSKSRADDYQDWRNVGLALHNTSSSGKYLNTWVEFSKKSAKFVKGTCEKFWGAFNKKKTKGLTAASIYYWAKIDNPEGFRKSMGNYVYEYIEHINGESTHCDIASIIHMMYRHVFVCSSIKHRTWYRFYEHRWTISDSGTNIRRIISGGADNELVGIYMGILNKVNDEQAAAEDEDEEDIAEKQKMYFGILKKLKTTSFKDAVLKECMELFYNSHFEEKLDSNPYLIGFENGVYDLEELEFRDGKPDDYLTKTTKINYIVLNKSDKRIDEINSFFEEIQINENIRKYLLTDLATYLCGVNKREKFRFWLGSGGNGKSKLIELLNSAFGEYSIKFPITLITGKRAASNAPTPEIVQAKGCRLAYLEEPNHGADLNEGLMKEYTGGDNLKGRGLHKDPIEFKPQFKMMLLCNFLPKLRGDDGGIWRRTEAVPFRSKFVEKPNPAYDTEFKIDTDLSKKLKIWGEPFMALLIEYYKVYHKEGITVPEEIREYTKEYELECDEQRSFFNERIIISDGSTVKFKECFSTYSMWAMTNEVKTRLSFKEFVKYLTNIYPSDKVNKKGKKLLDHKLILTDDDEYDDDSD